MRRFIIILLCFLFIPSLFLTSCTHYENSIYFSTNCNIELKGANVKSTNKQIFDLFEFLDQTLSTSILSSDIAKINNSPVNSPTAISQDTKTLFKLSLQLYSFNNNFNPAIFPIVQLWHFGPDTYTGAMNAIPLEEEIQATLLHCNLDYFILDETNMTITKSSSLAKLDFGSIAKGYACDKAFDLTDGYKRAIINVGGTIKTKNKIQVHIKNPREKANPFAAIITIEDEAISTSGDYERFYILEDQRYHHIFDLTGHPAGIFKNDPIISVSVTGKDATICDALSTLIFIDGLNDINKDILNNFNCKALIFYNNHHATFGDISYEIVDESYAPSSSV